MRAALAGAVLLLGACYSPDLQNCVTTCGTSGSCPGGLECNTAGYCVHPGFTGGCGGGPDGAPCSGANGDPCPGGLCHDGSCDSTSCFIAGQWIAGGARDPANDCQQCDAPTDRLAWTVIADGGACTASPGAPGTCWIGACCGGCWDGGTCQAGTSTSACGAGGAACAACSSFYCNACSDACSPPQDALITYACITGSCVEQAPQCCGTCGSPQVCFDGNC